jgi:ubiquinol-cytochrome c reductase iron-sulfur subunit
MSEVDKAPGDGADEHDEMLTDAGRPRPADVEHHIRLTDVDPRIARRAERQVALMFGLSALLTLGFLVAYVAIPTEEIISLPVIGDMSASNFALGLLFGGAVLLIGIGAIHWAKKLMTDVEVVQPRHPSSSEAADRAAAIEVFEVGAAESGFAKHTMVRRTLIGAMALFPLPLVIMLRDLWITPPDSPGPSAELSETIWRKGTRIVTDPALKPLRPEDIPVGGLVNAIPADLPAVEEEAGNLNARAKAAIILIRMDPGEIRSQQAPDWKPGTNGWGYEGILAFSKICTHVGCPISLYEQRTHHLLCPCHQSTFDLADSANVVFGPANRHMPQLPITLDDQGYLVAQSDFAEPVGPSFWERG